MPTTPIKQFGPIQSLTESTEVGISLTRATNILLRPNKGFRGIPLYYRLFGIGNSTAIQTTLRALPFTGYPGGIGADAGARTANKTVAIQIECQAKNFLLFYDLTATAKPCRGWFYLGEKGTVPATLNLDSGTVTYTVLAVGLDAAARWYGTRAYSEWLLGNGVDDNVIVQLNRTKTPGVWREAASNVKPAAPVLGLVPPANSGLTQASWTVDTRLKITANADNYPGISGNGTEVTGNRIRVQITPTVATLTSVLTGSGTPITDPFLYSITGGATGGGTAAIIYPDASTIKTFINADTKVLSILDALLTGSDAPLSNPSGYGPTFLAGGAGTGTSTGFSDRVATVIARYWDPGDDGLGYEGVSSDESNTLIISAAQNYDLRVTVTPDPSAEGGRFPFIRIYLNFISDDGSTEIFSLMNPNDPIPNTTPVAKPFTTPLAGSPAARIITTSSAHELAVNDVIRFTTTGTLPAGLALNKDYSVLTVPSPTTMTVSATASGPPITITTAGTGTHSLTQQRVIQLGTNSEIGQAMSTDQNRPLPHTHHVIANGQVWGAGVTNFQERLYASKAAPVDERVPEGFNTDDFVNVQSTSSAAGSAEITALYTDGQWLHLHTPAGILLKDPTDPTAQPREPQVPTGAINGATMVPMPDRRILYVGSDLSLMAFDASIQLQEIVGNASVASAAATSYLRERVDTDAIAANNDRAHAFLDTVGQLLWLYLPGKASVSNGELIGFAYDLINDGIVGEFTFPRVYASAMMEKTRPEITWADEDGNLFYTDPTAQPDHSDNYGAQGAFTPQATGTAIPVADNGYGNVIYDAGAGNQRYLRAYTAYLETGYWDLGDPASRKAFMAFCWRTIAGSRAIMQITLESLSGATETFTLGDVGEYGCNHRAPLMMSDSAIKAKITILSAQQKKWAVRDCAFDWTPQTFGSV